MKQVLKTLKNRKAHGSDGVTGEALKCIAPWITQDITKIMNQIQQGEKITQRMDKWSCNTHLQKQGKPTRMQLL